MSTVLHDPWLVEFANMELKITDRGLTVKLYMDFLLSGSAPQPSGFSRVS